MSEHLLFHIFNFALIALALGFILKRKLGSYYAQQRKELQDKMNLAKKEEELIRQEYEEMKALVDGLDGRIAELRLASKKVVEFETNKVESETKRQIEKLANEAKRKIAQESERARVEIQKEVVAEAIRRAKTALSKEMLLKDETWTADLISGATAEGKEKNYAS